MAATTPAPARPARSASHAKRVRARWAVEEIGAGAADDGASVAVGTGVGGAVGSGVGSGLGGGEGLLDGGGVGIALGRGVGIALGCGVGVRLGSGVGACVGAGVGSGVGRRVGAHDGTGDALGALDTLGTALGAARQVDAPAAAPSSSAGVPKQSAARSVVSAGQRVPQRMTAASASSPSRAIISSHLSKRRGLALWCTSLHLDSRACADGSRAPDEDRCPLIAAKSNRRPPPNNSASVASHAGLGR